MQTERKGEIDLLRVIAMLFVIAIHTLYLPSGTAGVGEQAVTALLFVSNGAFFAISGRLNLSKHLAQRRMFCYFTLSGFLRLCFPYL